MKPALRRFAGRLPLMAASLVLATAFWFYVNAREQVEVGHLVPLVFERFPARLVLDGAPLEAVYVRLRGGRSVMDALDPQQLRVRVDLASARAGNNVVPLAAPLVVVPRGVTVVGISPPAVNLRFIARPRTGEEGTR
ncbi:MAG TPA: CdaR family protein [bacterium]